MCLQHIGLRATGYPVNTYELGGTTYSKLSSKLGDSRLDRAYMSRRFGNDSSAVLVDGSPEVSDHAGVCVTLSQKRAAPASLDELDDSDMGAQQPMKRQKREAPSDSAMTDAAVADK